MACFMLNDKTVVASLQEGKSRIGFHSPFGRATINSAKARESSVLRPLAFKCSGIGLVRGLNPGAEHHFNMKPGFAITYARNRRKLWAANRGERSNGALGENTA